jgi:DNA invertase Pin-like site-specific DNA recombinase
MTAPAAPAGYIRAAAARSTDDPAIARQRYDVLAATRALGWPEPTVSTDAGRAVSAGPSRFTAPAVAIIEGRHDAVIMTGLARISRNSADAVALARLCDQHGAVLQLTSGEPVRTTNPAPHAHL